MYCIECPSSPFQVYIRTRKMLVRTRLAPPTFQIREDNAIGIISEWMKPTKDAAHQELYSERILGVHPVVKKGLGSRDARQPALP